MKIPQARANAADASFPTFVDDGSECLRMRRMQARGGSNSIADGRAPSPFFACSGELEGDIDILYSVDSLGRKQD